MKKLNSEEKKIFQSIINISINLILMAAWIVVFLITEIAVSASIVLIISVVVFFLKRRPSMVIQYLLIILYLYLFLNGNNFYLVPIAIFQGGINLGVVATEYLAIGNKSNIQLQNQPKLVPLVPHR